MSVYCSLVSRTVGWWTVHHPCEGKKDNGGHRRKTSRTSAGGIVAGLVGVRLSRM